MSGVIYGRSAQILRSATRARPRQYLARAMASSEQPSTFVLQYKYIPDILEKRGPHREGHLNAIKKGIADSKILLGGAIADPVDGALLIFTNSNKAEVDAYAKEDPYHKHGLIESYTIRPFLRVQ